MDRYVQKTTYITSDHSDRSCLGSSIRCKHSQPIYLQDDSLVCPRLQSPNQAPAVLHPDRDQPREPQCNMQNIRGADNQWRNDGNVRSTNGDHPRILVIGDKLIYVTIKDQLALQGYQVQYVNSIHAALPHIEENLTDLVIYDVISPHFDGSKLNQELTSNDKTQRPPIIFLVERNQMPELINGLEAGSNDYLVKPFTKYELLIRVRTQLVLINVNYRLTKLRLFTNQLANDKDFDTMLHRTFCFLQGEPCLSDVTLFREDIIRYSNCKEKSAIEAVFYQAKHTIQNETFYATCQGSYYCFVFRLSDLQSWTFIIRIARKAFFGLEKEYIKNVFNQICIVQDNLHSDICDPTTITSLYAIISKQDHLLFVKSAKQYVELHAKKHRPELLAISLKRVGRYFKDQLFKVHRSYLVNPNEIQKIRRKKRGRYEILISEHVIPVGELYLPALRNKFSHWF